MSPSHADCIWEMALIPDLKFYLLALCRLADDTGACTTTRMTLSHQTGYGEYSLRRQRSMAIASKLVEVVAHGRGDRPTPYTLTIPEMQGGHAA